MGAFLVRRKDRVFILGHSGQIGTQRQQCNEYCQGRGRDRAGGMSSTKELFVRCIAYLHSPSMGKSKPALLSWNTTYASSYTAYGMARDPTEISGFRQLLLPIKTRVLAGPESEGCDRSLSAGRQKLFRKLSPL